MPIYGSSTHRSCYHRAVVVVGSADAGVEEATKHGQRLEGKLRHHHSIVARGERRAFGLQRAEDAHNQHHQHRNDDVGLHGLSRNLLLQRLGVTHPPHERTRSSSFNFWIAFFCFFSSLADTIWSFFLSTARYSRNTNPTLLGHLLQLSRHGLVVRSVVDKDASDDYASASHAEEWTFSRKIDNKGQEHHADRFLEEASHVVRKN